MFGTEGDGAEMGFRDLDSDRYKFEIQKIADLDLFPLLKSNGAVVLWGPQQSLVGLDEKLLSHLLISKIRNFYSTAS